MAAFTNHTLGSTDGTEIGYRRTGDGPTVVLVHGGLLASQHFVSLATELAPDFEVIVPDRRGRGMSGPYRDSGARIIDQEAADVRALVRETAAHNLFGLSSGAVVCLNATLGTDAVHKLALYEPPLSVNGSAPLGWSGRYERELAAGKTASALITGMRGLGTDRVMSRIPHAASPVMSMMLRAERPGPGEVPIRDLVPTWHYDFTLIRETADTEDDYAAIASEVLLIGGSKSPAFLDLALGTLDRVMPNSRRMTLPGLGHQAAVDQPDRVAAVLRDFFA